MNRDQLAEHLKFAAELGVAGVSRDPVWRTRAETLVLRQAQDERVGERRDRRVGDPLNPQLGDALDPGGTPTPASGPLILSPSTDEHAVIFSKSAAEALAAVRADIGDCTRCKLHTLGRTQVVFGVGNPDAELMFVGEAPGGDEDVQGVPFVGRAGQLLTKIIEAIDLKRDDVYIANVIKCRPPGNRNPEPDEIEICEPFLFRQIEIIKPKIIVTLGKFAAQTLLRTDAPISRVRGRVFDYRGAKLIPTFHPAYLLRNPSSKREVWEDMKLVKRLLKSEV
jgi:DNA polymerase